MKKPANLIYGVDDSPPLAVTVFNGVQHVGLIGINLVYPLLVFRVADTPVQALTNLMAIGMLVLGVATFLQALRLGPVGSGYMCPATFSASYFPASLLAAKLGGLPLVFGMTIFAGVLEAALAPLLNRLRAIFPIEISGLVIFMIGWSAGIAGLRLLLGTLADPVSAAEWSVAGITLATMVALNVWGKGPVRMLCALIGLAAGYAAAGFTGLVGAGQLSTVGAAPWVGLPAFGQLSRSFDVALAVPFAIACLAASLKAVGTITVCQRMNDADWVRPNMQSAMRGVLADGVSTALAGVAGAVGTNTSTPSVGLASATGMASRKVAFAVGAIFMLLGLLPKLAAMLALVPRPVVVAALLFAVSFLLINGLQVITSAAARCETDPDHWTGDRRWWSGRCFSGDRRERAEGGQRSGRVLVRILDADRPGAESAVPYRGEKDGESEDRIRSDRPAEDRGLLQGAWRGVGRTSGRGQPRNIRRHPAGRCGAGRVLASRRDRDRSEL